MNTMAYRTRKNAGSIDGPTALGSAAPNDGGVYGSKEQA